MSVESDLSSLVQQTSLVVQRQNDWADGQVALLAGSIDDPDSFNANGGKTGALGYYPIKNVNGQTVYVPCLARVMAIAAGADPEAVEGILDAAATATMAANNAATAIGDTATKVNGLLPVSSIALSALGGTVNAITATIPAALGLAPAMGMRFSLRNTGVNTGPVTLSVNGGAALPILDGRGRPLVGGELTGSTPFEVRLSGNAPGTEWRITSGLVYPADFTAEAQARAASIASEAAARAVATSALANTILPVRERTAQVAIMPPLKFGPRSVQPEKMTYNRCLERGYWVDTGLPWLPNGAFDQMLPGFIYDGKWVLEMSYDRRIERAIVLATGEAYPPVAASAPMPQMEAEIASSTLIYLYVKQFGSTYVRWALDHAVNLAMRCDVWRIGPCHHVTRSAGGYTVVQEICFDGENDVALKFRKSIGGDFKPDHSGGKAHGNEVQTFSRLLLNTEVLDPTVATGRFEVNYIELIQTSDLFDPGNGDAPVYNGPRIINHIKRLRLTSDGWWEQWSHVDHIIGGYQVVDAYFGMVCLGWGTKGYNSVHTAARSPLYELEDVSGTFTNLFTPSDRLKAWGDTYAAEWEALDGWTFNSPGGTDRGRNININNRNDRRKIYPDWFEGQITSTDVPWDVHCRYRINIKETA